MSLRSLRGRHSTRILPPHTKNDCSPLHDSALVDNINKKSTSLPRLIVWSGADREGVNRISKTYANLYEIPSLQRRSWEGWLDDFAYTMGTHRTQLQWRSFALARSPTDLINLNSHMFPPVHVDADRPTRIGFVFSGQGAHWPGMGRQLLHYPAFREHMLAAERFLKSLGCGWSVIGEILTLVSFPERR